MSLGICSTPLRLTLLIIGVFVLFLAVGLAGAYATMRGALQSETEARLDQVIGEFRTIREADERSERASEITGAADPGNLMLEYETGGTTTGNLNAALDFEGYRIVRPAELGRSGESLADSYAGWSGRVGDARLTVLVGRESLSELNEIFAAILGFSVVPALLLTLAIGLVVTRRVAGRVDGIRRALARIGAGDLTARAPDDGPSTDLADIAREVNRMAAAQEAATEALRQVSSDIAHDLRTPIQRIAVLLERLQATGLNHEAQSHVEEARRQTAQIIETFRTLLQIAQLEGGQGRAMLRRVDLAALARDVAEVYAIAAEESGHAIDVSTTAPAVVHGDRTLLSRLLANLIENALRHTECGRIDIALDGTELTVADEGPGIPEAEREAVLRRLYRREASRTTPGSGLGLALVKAIADLHGASLDLGDAGPGLQVRLRFRLAENPAQIEDP